MDVNNEPIRISHTYVLDAAQMIPHSNVYQMRTKYARTCVPTNGTNFTRTYIPIRTYDQYRHTCDTSSTYHGRYCLDFGWTLMRRPDMQPAHLASVLEAPFV
eukprot:1383384-Amorphochlora_amoeboformis.AAC.1